VSRGVVDSEHVRKKGEDKKTPERQTGDELGEPPEAGSDKKTGSPAAVQVEQGLN